MQDEESVNQSSTITDNSGDLIIANNHNYVISNPLHGIATSGTTISTSGLGGNWWYSVGTPLTYTGTFKYEPDYSPYFQEFHPELVKTIYNMYSKEITKDTSYNEAFIVKRLTVKLYQLDTLIKKLYTNG